MARNLVNLEGVRKGYGTRTLLDGVSLGLGEGDRVGVVGRNGGGKSTLLRLLARHEAPDEGGSPTAAACGSRRSRNASRSTRRRPCATSWSVAAPRTRGRRTPACARCSAACSARRCRWTLDAMLDRLGGALSGGERRRVSLAQALIGQHDLLVLDEPTNHLDVDGIYWLAEHLAARREALVVVTHDRWFLDEVCTATWEVAGGDVHAYEGGYSAYVLARAERERMQAATDARRANLLRKELAWLRRGPPARTSKPRFRIDAANALIAEEPPPRDGLELMRFASARLGKTVYDAADVTVEMGGRVLLDDLTWQVGPGDRIGIVGRNGSGKTTLLRVLAGALAPAAGKVVRGVTVRPAYLSQDVVELRRRCGCSRPSSRSARVLDLGKGRTITATQLCERFGFVGNAQWTPVGELSGGERRRLQLLRLLMDEPNVLVLDEPTNDLDIDTLTALEDLLDGWPGTLARGLPRPLFRRARLRPGGRAARRRPVARPARRRGRIPRLRRARRLPGACGASPRRRPATGAAGEAVPVPTDAAATRTARKELARLERTMEKLRDREVRLHADLAAAATDHERVLALDATARIAKNKL